MDSNLLGASSGQGQELDQTGFWMNLRKKQRKEGLTTSDLDGVALYNWFLENGRDALAATLRRMRAVAFETDVSEENHVVAIVLTSVANKDLRTALAFEAMKLKTLSAMPSVGSEFLEVFKRYMWRRYGDSSLVLSPSAREKFPHFTYFVGPTSITIE